jgi:hypothetical protein
MSKEERDNYIGKALVRNMTEEQRNHLYKLLTAHDEAVQGFLTGKLDFFPGIQINFVQIGQVALKTQRLSG